MGEKRLCLWKRLFFEMFVSIDHLGPEEMILTLAQYLSKYIVDPSKMSSDFFQDR